MIATLRGVVADKSIDTIVLDVGGVGYGVVMPKSDIEEVDKGSESQLFIYEVIREDAHDLYGFVNTLGRSLFGELLTVSGVGPKAALAVLSVASVEDARNAIAVGDVAFLQSASGVGKRTAERIAVELKDKVVGTGSPSDYQPESSDAALEGLEALGYPRSEAVAALSRVPRDIDDSERIKRALKEI